MTENSTPITHIKRLERSSDGMVAGVAGGLGRYFELNPAVFRLGFVILTLLGGAGVLVYLAAVLVVPVEGTERSIAAQVLEERRDRPWPVVGLGLAGVALVLLLSRGAIATGAGWVAVLVGGLAILWASRRQWRARRLLAILTALVVAGVLATCIAVVAAFAWLDVDLGDGIGTTTYVPATASAIQSSYRLGIGDLRIDLSQVRPAGSRRIDARLGIGELKIIVPHDASVRVDAHAKAGEVFVLRQHDDGRNAQVRTGHGQLVIDARVGAGRIDVVRAP